MRISHWFIALVIALNLATPPARADPQAPQIVNDPKNHVTWLADANLAATQTFGVPNINKDGSMSYSTAVQWVAAMNAAHYLGHANWQLPTTPNSDRNCASKGPHKNSFGFGCSNGSLGSLFYGTFGAKEFSSAVSVPDHANGSFQNIQPHFYWSATLHGGPAVRGFTAYSFNTGVQIGITSADYLHVLPMIKGQVKAPDLVYDPAANVTWLADGNLASTKKFGVSGISQTGAMSHESAEAWVAAMRQRRYLGQTNWELPPTVNPDPSCSVRGRSGPGCTGSPMNMLYGQVLGLHGESVMPALRNRLGQFRNVQPYPYWTCTGDTTSSPCGTAPAPGMQWDFDFSNGFLNTDITQNIFYVMVYFPMPEPRVPSPHHAPPCPIGRYCPPPA